MDGELDWVDALLHGVALDEGADCPLHPGKDCGWWPTTPGAVFGAGVLAELKAEIQRRYL